MELFKIPWSRHYNYKDFLQYAVFCAFLESRSCGMTEKNVVAFNAFINKRYYYFVLPYGIDDKSRVLPDCDVFHVESKSFCSRIPGNIN